MGVSPGSNPSPFIYDCLGPEVISISDNSDLERLLVDSQVEGATSRYSSFDALLCDDDAREDHAATYIPHSSRAAEVSTYHTLSSLEMLTTRLRRTCWRVHLGSSKNP